MKVENTKVTRMNAEESISSFVSLQINDISEFCLIFSVCDNCKYPYFIDRVSIFSLRYS